MNDNSDANCSGNFSIWWRWWTRQPWCVSTQEIEQSLDDMKPHPFPAALALLFHYEKQISNLASELRKQADTYLPLFRNVVEFGKALLAKIVSDPHNEKWDMACVRVSDFVHPCCGGYFVRFDPWLLQKMGVQMNSLCDIELCGNASTQLIFAPADQTNNALQWADFIFTTQQPDYGKCIYYWHEHVGCDDDNNYPNRLRPMYNKWCSAVRKRQEHIMPILALFLPSDVYRFLVLPYCSL